MPQQQKAPGIAAGSRKAPFKHNGLSVECIFSETGKLRKKRERQCGKTTEFTYQFDRKGHLLTVSRDGRLEEEYCYNQAGQRIEQRREYNGAGSATEGRLGYDEAGHLTRAGETSFEYDRNGALSERCDCQGVTRYFYGKDTMLDRVILPGGEEIRYEYSKANPLAPARRFKNGELTSEYVWLDPLRLAAYLDHEHDLEYRFRYDAEGRADRVRVAPLAPGNAEILSGSDWLGGMVTEERKARLHRLFRAGKALELFCGCDQVGTLKVLTDADGRLIKEIAYDSFGVPCHDTLPDLFMPIGFAGGLADPDTGLVRFGWRDYDPTVGRFTAPDPLGDTGGDHDLYDYCVDDPVSFTDKAGLTPAAIPPLAIYIAAKLGALGLGLGGTYGAAYVVDKIKSKKDGEESTETRDTIKKVAPEVVDAWWDAATMGRSGNKLGNVRKLINKTEKKGTDDKE